MGTHLFGSPMLASNKNSGCYTNNWHVLTEIFQSNAWWQNVNVLPFHISELTKLPLFQYWIHFTHEIASCVCSTWCKSTFVVHVRLCTNLV